MIYPIQKTGSGIATIGIGGGAFTKTFRFRTVLKKDPKNMFRYSPKAAGFIRTTGDLACQIDQGLTPINPGDLIVTGSGALPINPDNPAIQIRALRVIQINDDHAIVYEEGFKVSDLPDSILTGAQIYHNRDGSFFADGVWPGGASA